MTSKARALAEKAIDLRRKSSEMDYDFWVNSGMRSSNPDSDMINFLCSDIIYKDEDDANYATFSCNNITTLSNMLLKCIEALEEIKCVKICKPEYGDVLCDRCKTLSELESMTEEK